MPLLPVPPPVSLLMTLRASDVVADESWSGVAAAEEAVSVLDEPPMIPRKILMSAPCSLLHYSQVEDISVRNLISGVLLRKSICQD